MGAFDGEVAQREGDHLVEEIVVVAPEIDHLHVGTGEILHDELEEGGVPLLPFARLAELPAVDDVAVQDELVTTVVSEEPDDLPDAGVSDAQVEVGDDDGSVVVLQGIGFFEIPSWVLSEGWGIVNSV
jgi:hypothetical protein